MVTSADILGQKSHEIDFHIQHTFQSPPLRNVKCPPSLQEVHRGLSKDKCLFNLLLSCPMANFWGHCLEDSLTHPLLINTLYD